MLIIQFYAHNYVHTCTSAHAQELVIVMQKMPEIMKTDEARRVVRNYNRIQEVLLEFEMMYHGGWLRGLAAASQCKFPNVRSRPGFSECVFCDS